METQETIVQRIRVICREFYSGNMSRMARQTGVRQSLIRDISLGKCRTIGADKLQLIIENTTPYISALWLLTGRGEMCNDGLISPISTESAPPQVPDYRDKYIAALEEITALQRANAALFAENADLKKALVAGHTLPTVASENETTAGTRQKVA